MPEDIVTESAAQVVKAPAELEPLCTRERLTAPPDWRYQAAVQYLDDERRGETPTVPADPVVQYAIRGLRVHVTGRRGSTQGRRYMYRLWPVVEEVFYYGITDRKSAISAEMDAYLIHGMNRDQARAAGCPVSGEVYDLYASLFFDLSGIRAVHSWIQDFLIEPERQSGDTRLLRARLLAYVGGPDAFSGSTVTGMLTSSGVAAMKNMMKSERQKQLFDYMVKKTRIDPVNYATIMEAAIKGMTDRDFQEHMKDRDEAGSGSIEELAEHMEEGIRAFSQAELASQSSDGLDFVNQYTRLLTGKKDGKENQS